MALPFALVSCDLEVLCPAAFRAAISVEVRDQFGEPAALGTTVRVESARVDAQYIGWENPLTIVPGEWNGGVPRPGPHYVTISRPWHTTFDAGWVDLEGDRCGVTSTVGIDVRLERDPNAPAVRQLVIAPFPMYFGDGNVEYEVWYEVIKEPGAPDSLRWWSSDTTVVTVDQNAVATSRCQTEERRAWVFGQHVRDAAVFDSVEAIVREPGSSSTCSTLPAH